VRTYLSTKQHRLTNVTVVVVVVVVAVAVAADNDEKDDDYNSIKMMMIEK
jgi:hypothetical protein